MPLGDGWNRIKRHNTSKVDEHHSLASSAIAVIHGRKLDIAFI